MQKTALILGPTGRFGRNADRAFRAAGWRTRCFRRGDDLTAAARGVDVIVNGWNPPYHHWKVELPGLTQQVIDTARVSGATIIVPGNVYPYGQGSGPGLEASQPHAATNPLGRLRVEMEAAYRASGLRTIILRGGDFIDTEASGNWYDSILTAKSRKGKFTYPGDPTLPHAWAFLPDMARAAVGLAELGDKLPVFADIPFAGYTLTGRELAAHVELALGVPQQVRKFNWPLVGALRPVWPLARGIYEMRYLWNMPHYLPAEPLAGKLPDFSPTPVQAAVARSLKVDVDPDKAVPRGQDNGIAQTA